MSSESVPEEYLCEQCDPREVDAEFAKSIQNKRREEERSKMSGNQTQPLTETTKEVLIQQNQHQDFLVLQSQPQLTSTSSSKTKEINVQNPKGRKLSQSLDLSNVGFTAPDQPASAGGNQHHQPLSSASSTAPTTTTGRGGKRKQSQTKKQQSITELTPLSATTPKGGFSNSQTPREEKSEMFDGFHTPLSAGAAGAAFNMDGLSGLNNGLDASEKLEAWHVEFTPIGKNIIIESKVLENLSKSMLEYEGEKGSPIKGTISASEKGNSGSKIVTVPIAPKSSQKRSGQLNQNGEEKIELSFRPTIKGAEFGLSPNSNECIPIEITSPNSNSLSGFNSKTYVKHISETASSAIFATSTPTPIPASSTFPDAFSRSSSASAPSGPIPSKAFSKPVMHGLFAESTISSGSFILEFRGELLTTETYKKNPLNQYSSFGIPKPHVHFFPKPFNLAIDSRRFGNESRFARNSCHPNAVIRPILFRKNGGNTSSGGMRTPASNRSRSQSPVVFSKLGIENKDSLLYNQNSSTSMTEEPELLFGIFALTEIPKTHEITLGWEWDDDHIVHFLPELVKNPYLENHSSLSPFPSSLKRSSTLDHRSRSNSEDMDLDENSNSNPFPQSQSSRSRERQSSQLASLSSLSFSAKSSTNSLPYLNTLFSLKMNMTLTSILGSCLCGCIGSSAPPIGSGVTGSSVSASSNNAKKQDCAIVQMLRVSVGMSLLNVVTPGAKVNRRTKLPDFRPLVGIRRGWNGFPAVPNPLESKKMIQEIEDYDEELEEQEILNGSRMISRKFRNQLENSLDGGIQRISEQVCLKAIQVEALKRQKELQDEISDAEMRGSDSEASSLTDPLSGLSDIAEDEDDEEELERHQNSSIQDEMIVIKKDAGEDEEDYDGPWVLPLKKRVSGTRIKASNDLNQPEEDHTPNLPSNYNGVSMGLNLVGKRKRISTKDSNEVLLLNHLNQAKVKAGRTSAKSNSNRNESSEEDEEDKGRSRSKKKARIEKSSSSSGHKRSKSEKKKTSSSSKRPFDQSSPLSSLADGVSGSGSDGSGEAEEDDSDELSEESRNSSLSPAPEEEDDDGTESEGDQKSKLLDDSSSPIRRPGRRRESLNSKSSGKRSRLKKLSKMETEQSSDEDEDEEGQDEDGSSGSSEDEEEESSLPRSRRMAQDSAIESKSQRKAKAKEKARRKALRDLADSESSEEEVRDVKPKEKQSQKVKSKEVERGKEKTKTKLKKKEKELKAMKKEKEIERERKKQKKNRRVLSSEEDSKSQNGNDSSSSTEVRARKRSKFSRDGTPMGRTPEPEFERRPSNQDSMDIDPQLQPQVETIPTPTPVPEPAPEPPKPEPPRAKLSLADYKKRLAERKVPTTSSTSNAEGAVANPVEPPTLTSASGPSKVPGIPKSSLPSFSKVSTPTETPSVAAPSASFFASIGAPTALKSVEIPKSPPTPSRALPTISASNAPPSIAPSTSIRKPWVPPTFPNRDGTSIRGISIPPKASIITPLPSPSLNLFPSNIRPTGTNIRGVASQATPVSGSPTSEAAPAALSPESQDPQTSAQSSWGPNHQRTASLSAGSGNSILANQAPQARARATSNAPAVSSSTSQSFNPLLPTSTSPIKEGPPPSPRATSSIPSSPRLSASINSSATTKPAPAGFKPLGSDASRPASTFPAQPAVPLAPGKFNPPRGPRALINTPAVVPPSNSSASSSSTSAVNPISRPPLPSRTSGPSLITGSNVASIPSQTRPGRAESVGSDSSAGWRNVNSRTVNNGGGHTSSSPPPASIHHHRASVDSGPSSIPRGPGGPSHRGGFGMGFRGRGATIMGGANDRDRERDRERERERHVSPSSDRPPPPLRPSAVSTPVTATSVSTTTSISGWNERVPPPSRPAMIPVPSSNSVPPGAGAPPSRGGGFPRGSGWGSRTRGRGRR